MSGSVVNQDSKGSINPLTPPRSSSNSLANSNLPARTSDTTKFNIDPKAEELILEKYLNVLRSKPEEFPALMVILSARYYYKTDNDSDQSSIANDKIKNHFTSIAPLMAGFFGAMLALKQIAFNDKFLGKNVDRMGFFTTIGVGLSLNTFGRYLDIDSTKRFVSEFDNASQKMKELPAFNRLPDVIKERLHFEGKYFEGNPFMDDRINSIVDQKYISSLQQGVGITLLLLAVYGSPIKALKHLASSLKKEPADKNLIESKNFLDRRFFLSGALSSTAVFAYVAFRNHKGCNEGTSLLNDQLEQELTKLYQEAEQS